MEVPVVSPMLALFRSDVAAYEPEHSSGPLQAEDGNP